MEFPTAQSISDFPKRKQNDAGATDMCNDPSLSKSTGICASASSGSAAISSMKSSCAGLSATANMVPNSSVAVSMSCSSTYSHSSTALANNSVMTDATLSSGKLCSSSKSSSSVSRGYLNSTAQTVSNTTSRNTASNVAVSTHSVPNMNSASLYSHLRPLDHIILPPPPPSCSSSHCGSASSSRLSGKFWAEADDHEHSVVKNSLYSKGRGKKKKKAVVFVDDLDEGIDYNLEDVIPSGSYSNSNKRHTRNNPQY